MSTSIRIKLIASIKRDVAAIVRRDPGDRDLDLSYKLFARLDAIEGALGWSRPFEEELTCRELGRRIVALASSTAIVDLDDLTDAAHTATFVRHVENYRGVGLGVGASYEHADKLADDTLAKAGALARYQERHMLGQEARVA